MRPLVLRGFRGIVRGALGHGNHQVGLREETVRGVQSICPSNLFGLEWRGTD